jgi:hypothetical protein
MTESPTLPDDPLDLATLPDLDVDTELSVEPTESAPAIIDPHSLADRIAETAYQLADTASKLPGLLVQRDDIADRMQDAQREYTAAIRQATETFSTQMEPLSEELKSTDAAIEAARDAKAQLDALASPPK